MSHHGELDFHYPEQYKQRMQRSQRKNIIIIMHGNVFAKTKTVNNLHHHHHPHYHHHHACAI